MNEGIKKMSRKLTLLNFVSEKSIDNGWIQIQRITYFDNTRFLSC